MLCFFFFKKGKEKKRKTNFLYFLIRIVATPGRTDEALSLFLPVYDQGVRHGEYLLIT